MAEASQLYFTNNVVCKRMHLVFFLIWPSGNTSSILAILNRLRKKEPNTKGSYLQVTRRITQDCMGYSRTKLISNTQIYTLDNKSYCLKHFITLC